MRTTDVIDRISSLEAMGRLTGVMDERGKVRRLPFAGDCMGGPRRWCRRLLGAMGWDARREFGLAVPRCVILIYLG